MRRTTVLINFAVDGHGRSCQLVQPLNAGIYGKNLRPGQEIIVSVGDDEYAALIVQIGNWIFTRPDGNHVLVGARTLSRRVRL